MADMTDAAGALVSLIAGIVYPAGPAAPSLTGDTILVYQGSPNPLVLTADLAAGRLHISVFPRPGDKVTSISQDDDDWEEGAITGAIGTAVLELRRQTRIFQTSIWAGSFVRRDLVAAAVDAGLAAVSRLSLADGSRGIMTYEGSAQIDDEQKAGIYRRDLAYAVNYATTQSIELYAVKHTMTNLTPGVNGSDIATISATS
jgi:hypothetical protein